MDAEIIAIGNEVTDGTIVNSNAAYLASALSREGYRVKFHTAVPDTEALMLDALGRAQDRAQVVLVTGGLGPTIDDLTMAVAAKYFQTPLQLDAVAWKKIQKFFESTGRVPSPNQESQAWLPKGSEVLANGRGTAPGVYYCHRGVHFGFFPGIPPEMELMFNEGFLPILRRHLTPVTRRFLKVIRCFGLPEGQMDQTLRDTTAEELKELGLNLGFRVRFPSVDLRLEAESDDDQEVKERLEAGVHLLQKKLGDHIFGTGDQRLTEVVGAMLLAKGQSLAVAESCTGGLLANEITNAPGASAYFLGGFVTYANDAKETCLGVDPKILKTFGAVSSETVLAMAHGVQNRLHSDWGVATSGIAGPTGGIPDKPVGTVHVAVVGPHTQWERCYQFPFSRLAFKKLVVATALDRLRRILMKGPS